MISLRLFESNDWKILLPNSSASTFFSSFLGLAFSCLRERSTIDFLILEISLTILARLLLAVLRTAIKSVSPLLAYLVFVPLRLSKISLTSAATLSASLRIFLKLANSGLNLASRFFLRFFLAALASNKSFFFPALGFFLRRYKSSSVN